MERGRAVEETDDTMGLVNLNIAPRARRRGKMAKRVGAADGVNLKLGRRFLTTCLLRIPELELPRGDSGTAGGTRVQGVACPVPAPLSNSLEPSV
jgi:hypothetical protein